MAFLKELSARMQVSISNICKDGLCAGVSCGGIASGALVHPRGITPEEMIQFYIDEGPRIFSRGFLEPPPLLEPKFEDNYLAEVLEKHFGEATLNEALCPVFIPVWDMSRSEPWFYTERDYSPIWLACRATAAVPSYFKTWGPLVDGGMFGSNPTLWAIARARELYGMDAKLLIISVGTGSRAPGAWNNSLHGAGDLKWLLPAIRTLTEANPIVTELMAKWLIGPDDLYFRWQAPIPAAVDPKFDNGAQGNTAALIRFSAEVIAARPLELGAICDALASAAA